MLIIGVKDNENNRWKRNANNNKKKNWGREAIAKGWEINVFEHLS